MSKMLSNLISNIHAGIKDFLGPAVIDGRLNQSHLALATRCYWIQSRILRIPDRFGFFASGPPRLQVEESGILVFVVFVTCHLVFYAGLAVYLVSLLGNRPVKSFAALMGLICLTPLGFVWIHLCWSSRRHPDYVWKDWKVRME